MTDLDGRTSIRSSGRWRGACTGLHGQSLASTSLLEGLVLARGGARLMLDCAPAEAPPIDAWQPESGPSIRH